MKPLPLSLQVMFAGAAAVLFLWTNTPYDVDDAMITYRYAENLAAGKGFVYNPGERVLGTSAPLHAMILAGLAWAGLRVPWASNVLGLLASLGIVSITMRLAWYWSAASTAGLLAVAVLLVQAPFLCYSMAGMETPVYVLLVVGSLWALAREKSGASAALAALATVMRLDGIATLVAVSVGLAQRRRTARREAVVVGIVLVPWFAFCLFYFRSLLPQSLVAKHQHLVDLGASRFWIWHELVSGRADAPTFLTALGVLGIVTCLRRDGWSSNALPSIVWVCANIGGYVAVGLEYYEWYVVPLLPLLAAFASVGLFATIEALKRCWRWRGFRLAAGALLVTSLAPYVRHAHDRARAFKHYLICVERSRAEAGSWLREHAGPGSRVFTDAIGQIGYHSGLYILDGGGLVRPADQDEFERATHVVDHDEETDNAGTILASFETGWPTFPRRVVVRQYVADALRQP